MKESLIANQNITGLIYFPWLQAFSLNRPTNRKQKKLFLFKYVLMSWPAAIHHFCQSYLLLGKSFFLVSLLKKNSKISRMNGSLVHKCGYLVLMNDLTLLDEAFFHTLKVRNYAKWSWKNLPAVLYVSLKFKFASVVSFNFTPCHFQFEEYKIFTRNEN